MLCARVMRGISSIESSVAPLAATWWMASGAPSGSANPMTAWPACSGPPGGVALTVRRMSAPSNSSAALRIAAPWPR